MTRVKRGTVSHARRKRLLAHTKGFKWGRKSKYKYAKEALMHAWSFQFADRKKKKRTMRRLWTVRVNAAARDNGISYSKLIPQLKANPGLIIREDGMKMVNVPMEWEERSLPQDNWEDLLKGLRLGKLQQIKVAAGMVPGSKAAKHMAFVFA